MTNAQHTPGPLHPSEDEGSGALFIYSPKAVSIVARVSSAVITERNRADARLLAAAYTSYDKHCADPVAAAEDDLLGKALAALSKCLAILENERVVQAVTNEVEAGTEWFDVLDLVVAADEARAVLTKAGKDGQ